MHPTHGKLVIGCRVVRCQVCTHRPIKVPKGLTRVSKVKPCQVRQTSGTSAQAFSSCRLPHAITSDKLPALSWSPEGKAFTSTSLWSNQARPSLLHACLTKSLRHASTVSSCSSNTCRTLSHSLSWPRPQVVRVPLSARPPGCQTMAVAQGGLTFKETLSGGLYVRAQARAPSPV